MGVLELVKKGIFLHLLPSDLLKTSGAFFLVPLVDCLAYVLSKEYV